MGINGVIFINPFGVPVQSVTQAQRLKEEFIKLGVNCTISESYFRAGVGVSGLECDSANFDFAIYLDKDKYLSKLLESNGVRVFNSHRAIRLCDDKAETYIALKEGGFTLPKTLFAPLCYNKDLSAPKEAVLEIEKIINYPVIVKESFGSMGKGVYKADNKTALISLMEKLKNTTHFYQECIKSSIGKDIRVIVIGGRAVAAMKRVNKTDFRSNIALGGVGEKLELFGEYKKHIECAERASKVLGLDYGGVDILMGENDTPIVCEVNSNAFFGEIEKVTGVNVAKLYAEYVLNQIRQ